ncbi:hypothetical protein BD310DRAFT_324873 [Dichomitus squalens]|uniref:Uncharacterized protein n=1 Tax=Dichomitus squalens TaxID=114155 RepID=A0A4Q9PB38_9APHY|nr:hypothetical protein BD310DRAFT_324873 [Dichomitus squalens]
MKIRLLDTRTGQFVLEDPEKTDFAILSHVWDQVNGEQSYQDFRRIQSSYNAQGQLYFSRLPIAVTRRAFHKAVAPNVRRIRLFLTHQSATQSVLQFIIRHMMVIHYFWWTWFLHLFSIVEDASLAVFTLHLNFLSFPTVLAFVLGISLPSAFLLTILGIFTIWDDPDLSSKIREACRVTREAGYRYL